MTPELHPAAAAELEAAVRDGMKYGSVVARRLRIEAARVAQLLCDAPNIGEPIATQYRRFPLQGFPFSLVYRIDGERLRIVAVAHKRRRPGYWRQRR
jgi:plasmid stabilization system protein ParE